ncbi:hypothetical protein BDZ89DRAFT_1138686 [Hymenopellis radicata]|nr:hypothetical protein BDZ89DRAFT_1138686 [Hymenopellis radicata]
MFSDLPQHAHLKTVPRSVSSARPLVLSEMCLIGEECVPFVEIGLKIRRLLTFSLQVTEAVSNNTLQLGLLSFDQSPSHASPGPVEAKASDLDYVEQGAWYRQRSGRTRATIAGSITGGDGAQDVLHHGQGAFLFPVFFLPQLIRAAKRGDSRLPLPPPPPYPLLRIHTARRSAKKALRLLRVVTPTVATTVCSPAASVPGIT